MLNASRWTRLRLGGCFLPILCQLILFCCKVAQCPFLEENQLCCTFVRDRSYVRSTDMTERKSSLGPRWVWTHYLLIMEPAVYQPAPTAVHGEVNLRRLHLLCRLNVCYQERWSLTAFKQCQKCRMKSERKGKPRALAGFEPTSAESFVQRWPHELPSLQWFSWS